MEKAVGKKSQIRRGKKEQFEKERAKYRQQMEYKSTPWLLFWRRVDFWVYTVCLALVIAFPFVMKNSITTGDQAIIHTSKGDIEVELYNNDAPNTVKNFVGLAKKGYYDNNIWHRVIKGFMIQGGDPTGTGKGGNSIFNGPFDDEINANDLGLTSDAISKLEAQGYHYDSKLNSHKMTVGSLAMANAGPNTNGSQFFIVSDQDQPHLDGQHTVFGHVTKGMDVVKAISEVKTDTNDKPVVPVYITSVELK